MGLLDSDVPARLGWGRVRDAYEITKKPRGLDLYSFNQIPFAAMEAIPQGGQYAPVFTPKTPDQITSGTYFERGDVLVAKITPSFENGKQALVQHLSTPFGYATTEVVPLRAKVPRQDHRFLFFYLLHPDVRHYTAERMEGTTARQRVPDDVFLDLPFPRFDERDQIAIADALEIVHKGLDLCTQYMTVVRGLKSVAMRELFTRGLRGEPQKETEIGPIPSSWELVSFKSAREWLQYGTSTRCTTHPVGYPVLRIPNVGSGRVNADDLKYCDLPDEEAAKYLLVDGDLLFIRTNGVIERLGSCAVYAGEPDRALFASYLIRARPKPNIVPRFVAYFYGSERGTSLVAGSATPAADGKYNLNTGTIDSLPLPLPQTREEQQEIVAILDAIDCKIDLHRRKKAVLQELFKSLLHKLMTGEVQVSDLDLSALTALEEARS